MSEEKKLRRCSRCKSTQLLSTYFSINKKGEYMKTCDSCRKTNKQWAEKNKEKRQKYKKIYGKKYYEENKEQVLEKQKKYYEENKEKRKQQRKKYYEENKDKVKQQQQKYYEDNKDKINQYRKQWREENKEHIMKYREENKEKLLKLSKQYLKDKRHHCEHKTPKYSCKTCNPLGHLRMIVSCRTRAALKSNKSKKSIEYLGCDIKTFKRHIEETFKEGMSWKNYGEWEIDHHIPVLYQQDGIPPTLAEVEKRLYYTNTQAMWKTENMKKGNRFIG